MKKFILFSLVFLHALGCSTPSIPTLTRPEDLKNNSDHTYYCDKGKCVEQFCEGVGSARKCTYRGELALKSKLIDNEKLMYAAFDEDLWDQYCESKSKKVSPKVICHKGEKKIEKPQGREVIRSSETSSTFDEGGKKRIIYQQVFILK